MAEGIHVTNLPKNTTEKQLKVYFSNPRNGGGHVRQIVFPLPHYSAVILFESQNTVRDIIQKDHVLREHKLSVCPLPKQIYGSVKVELEKAVSYFIERNPHVVDELQYVGELRVEFHYEKEVYILIGAWYQLEWALHYLDELLDESDLQLKGQAEGHSKVKEQWQSFRQEYEPFNDENDVPQPIKHKITKPNIPMVKQPRNIKEKAAGNSKKTTPMEKETKAAKFDSKTVRQNLDAKGKDNQYYNNEVYDERNMQALLGQVRGAGRGYENRFDDSGSENEGYEAYYTRGNYGDQTAEKGVKFAGDTDFTENKSRPRKVAPRRTMGIDVAQTDFGEVPLMHEFTLANDLKVKVAMDDITKQSTDGIINPTDPDLSSLFGASRAIVQAGGYEMQIEMKQYLNKNGNLGWAEVFHTKSGGTLPRQVINVIHTASPLWREDDSETVTHYLVCTYINCFIYANTKLWLQSIATPVISAGAFGFPLDICIQAFYDALLLFSAHGEGNYHLTEIDLICFDEDTSMAAIVILQSLFDCDTEQAISAATDRYNSRCLKSKFEADTFNTGGASKTVREAYQPNRDKPSRQQQKNKNAKKTQTKSSERTDDYEDERFQKDEYKPLDEDEKVVEGASGDKEDESNQVPKKVMNFQRETDSSDCDTYSKKQISGTDRDGMKDKEDTECAEDLDDGMSSPRSSMRHANDYGNEGRKSPNGSPNISGEKIDAKKSLAGIDRPKFTDEPNGDGDDHGDDKEFDIGIIGADKYSKKFEDLIVSVNQTNDGEFSDDGLKEYQKADKGQDVNEELHEKENYKETSGHPKTIDEEIVTNEDNTNLPDKDAVNEESAESTSFDKESGGMANEQDHYIGSGIGNEDRSERYREDVDRENKEREETSGDTHDTDGRSFNENEYSFVDMSVDDAEIIAALDRELGAERNRVEARSERNEKIQEKELEIEASDESKEYPGPKVLDTDN